MSKKVCHRMSFLCGITASLIATLVSGFVFQFPFSFMKPVYCIARVGVSCPILMINWVNFSLDFAFWACIIFLAQIFSILTRRVLDCPKSKKANKEYQNMPFWIGIGIVLLALLLIFNLMGQREFQKPDFHPKPIPTSTPTPVLILQEQQSAPSQCTSCGCGK